jgi:2-aminoethylphosphonate-pyruvate transaminase
MKRRGYVIYAGQGQIATYGFRVANMGTLTPSDMAGVVAAFGACIEELRAS